MGHPVLTILSHVQWDTLYSTILSHVQWDTLLSTILSHVQWDTLYSTILSHVQWDTGLYSTILTCCLPRASNGTNPPTNIKHFVNIIFHFQSTAREGVQGHHKHRKMVSKEALRPFRGAHVVPAPTSPLSKKKPDFVSYDLTIMFLIPDSKKKL